MYHFKLNTQASFIADVLPEEDGEEYFIGSYEFENSLLDQWVGFGASFLITDHFAIGLSYFGIYRTYKYHNNIELTAFPVDTAYHHISEFRSSINFDYHNISGIFKLGLAWDYDKFAIGLNFTSPTFGLFGKANEQRIFKILNLDYLTNKDFAVIDREEKMPSHHRFPGSIGVGLNYVVSKKVVTYFSAEYFYHNALGDFDLQRVVAESINWDLYYVSLGIRKTEKKILTAGIEFSFSPKTKTNSFVNLSDPDGDNALIGDAVPATAQQFGLKFVVSYTIHGN